MTSNKKQCVFCEKINLFLASGLGAGFLPKTPGTFGTMSAMCLFILLLFCFGFGINEGKFIVGILAIYSVFFGVFVSNKILTYEKYKNEKDPQFIVIDEWAGYFITILFATTWGEIIAGFVIFRLLDIFKPWIIKKAEDLPRGYGVMADDIVAGIIGCVLMNLFLLCF